MDGFTGFKTAAVEELPDVVTVLGVIAGQVRYAVGG